MRTTTSATSCCRRIALCTLLWGTLLSSVWSAPAVAVSAKHAPIGTIDFRDVTVGDALRVLAEQSGLNIVASEKAGRIRTSLYLRGVRPMEVLEALARTYNLWYQQDPRSGIIRLYTAEEFRLGEVDSPTERTEIFTLRYPNAIEVAYAIRNLFGDRVYLRLGADRDDKIIDDLESRFERFDIVNSRSQRIGGLSSAAATAAGSNFGGSTVYDNDRNLRRSISGTDAATVTGGARLDVSAQDVEGAYLTGKALKRVEGLVAGSEQAGKEGLGEVIRLLSPIYVTVIRNQNRVLVRSRDSQAMAQVRDLVDQLDMDLSTLLMEVKILSVDLSDGFESVFNFDLTAGDLTLSVLPGARDINAALLATLVSEKFNARLQLLEREGRVTELATPMLLTTNQEVSRVFVGEERPVTTGYTSSAASTGGIGVIGDLSQAILVPVTEVRPVGTTLLLTPNINADRSVSVRIVVEQSAVSGTATIPVALPTGVGGTGGIEQAEVDVVSSRTFSGTVVGQDNLAVAVGGLIEEGAADREEKVPLLGDIPFVGGLFRDTSRARTRRELIVILRPHVMMTPTETARRSEDFLRGRSVHPESQTGDKLDIYRNPERDHAGYELQQAHKLYPGQDRFDRKKDASRQAQDAAGGGGGNAESLYADLTRLAFRATHEHSPSALPPDVERLDVRRHGQAALLPRSGVDAQPIAGWRKERTHVTTVRLLNQRPSEYIVDPTKLRGRWLAATPEQDRLGGAGEAGNSTYLYLVSDRPYHEALVR